MAALKNARRELFAQCLAKGLTQIQAYEQAGYKGSGNSHSSRVAAREDIRGRVNELIEIAQSAQVKHAEQEQVKSAQPDAALKARAKSRWAKSFNSTVKALNSQNHKPDSTDYYSPVEPWPTGVDGNELLEDLVCTIKRFCILPDYAPPLIAAWILHAWAHDCFSISPILSLTSLEKRCGKSIILNVIEALVPKAEAGVCRTESAFYRLINAHKPTLLIDEVDTFLKNHKGIQGMLNAGHKRTRAYVWRCAKIRGEVQSVRYSVWGPKAIAMTGDLPDKLDECSLSIELEQKNEGKPVEWWNHKHEDELLHLRQKAQRWLNDTQDVIESRNTKEAPQLPEGLHGRAADNAIPLCIIAETIGGDWPERIRDALSTLAGARKGRDRNFKNTPVP